LRIKGVVQQVICGHRVLLADNVHGKVRYKVHYQGGCHTPMLFGFILDGHKVTRRKEFCSDACKMKSARALRLSDFKTLDNS
jgi:hypothetical protein